MFDALGDEQTGELNFVSCDGASSIRDIVSSGANGAVIYLGTSRLGIFATDTLDELRRGEWRQLRRSSGARAAKSLKGLRFLLLRNWENLMRARMRTIRDLPPTNKRLLRAWQLN